ncbi:MAG: SCO6880 family protein [Acidimicrobiales bacterium]|nr:SCO6880 family protein [Acidimicrobiales bacterium]GJM36935.1 MAG: hypothetical protein DHS20C19_03020 [Acidimicrobiales bacterium]
MTTTSVREPRRFRLSPVDRTGWMFGLGLVQLLVIAVGVTLGAVAMVLVSPLAGVLVLAVAAGLGAARVGGESVVGQLPLGAQWLKTRTRPPATWFEPVPLLGGDGDVSLPPPFEDLDVLIVDVAHLSLGPPGTRAVVTHDTRAETVAATLRVTGRQFSLVEPIEQEWLVDAWGRSIGAFVSERNPVVSVRWAQWAAPAGLDEHRTWLAEQMAADPLDDVRAAYERLLREAGSHTTRHEVLVTVTLAVGKVRKKRDETDRLHAAVEALLTELRLFGHRLEGSGLTVSGVLSPSEWARAMRLRLDPSQRMVLDTRSRSLGETAGATSPSNAMPSATTSTWSAWQTDGVWHRALRVTEWPRLDVDAAWLSDLMLYAGCVRTMAVVLEPLSRSRSQRTVVRDSAKIESDAMHRAEKGFRVGAHHRRARQAVEEREEELVSGWGEFVYVGILVVTASTLEDLDDAVAELTQITGSLGMETKPLHGRHDLAMVVTLPVARGVVPKEWL